MIVRQRGRDYVRYEMVVRDQHPYRRCPGVHGSTDYAAGPEDALIYRCSCPMSASGSFCKHCTALALRCHRYRGVRTSGLLFG